ncbi:DUF2206 domain-containing protein [Actinoplanes sp. L3-i22]|uniref:DUF2206 domain-containing protein n=1 Tax=Actinoplanes sp. L3-i22 TaxID=2836373 RepID=UPI001C74D19C|nr:DUF2206 domain-containing protein [Actinoplanes sp. L3-i22]BCY15475.1 hypothetical protein L3i22_105630 [Actinoplanes sp. L3-i22]
MTSTLVGERTRIIHPSRHRSSTQELLGRQARRLGRQWPLLLITLVAALLEMLPVPVVVHAVAGLWLLFGAPIVLGYPLADRVLSTREGRLILAIGGAVLGDIVVALLVNTVLPWAGVVRPLTRIPLTLASVLFIVVLAVLSPAPARWVRPRMMPGLPPVLYLGGLALVLSIAAPIRLNNGLGSGVAIAALLAVAGLITFLFVRRRKHLPAVTGAGIFFVALSLVLITSLRGWYITGHDIQREYGVFQLTFDAGHWNIAAFRDAYNACLSINLFPTSVAQLTGISGVYVFKVVIPVLFAVAPVALYRTVRHTAPQSIAVLSAVYFVAFPTFFTDMAFLGRQEIAFLLLGCLLLLLADTGRPLRDRRIASTVLLVGIVLSHYSTTYVILGIFGLAWSLGLVWRLVARRRGGFGRFSAPKLITWWMIVVGAVAAVLWTGPATDTGQQARITATATVLELFGKKSATGSSDTGYSLFGGEKITTADRLTDYAATTEARTEKARSEGDYLPLSAIDKFPITAAEQANMPLTAIGRMLAGTGLDVVGLNTLIRLSVARLLQVLLLLGVIVTVFARRPVFRPSSDQVLMSLGSLGLIAILTVLPELSVDYGVLRAFQQGLFFFAPFIAAASVWAFRWAGKRATGLAFGMALVLFLDLVGVVPKLLGGYPPQLHLANAGQYYDIYYLHPEERAAITWIHDHASEVEREQVQSEVQTDRYTFGRAESLLPGRADHDIYPTLIGADTYVFLGFTTVRKDESTVFYRGDLVTYQYPIGLLDATKNKVYSSEGSEVYR